MPVNGASEPIVFGHRLGATVILFDEVDPGDGVGFHHLLGSRLREAFPEATEPLVEIAGQLRRG